jgi:hypothetical protein
MACLTANKATILHADGEKPRVVYPASTITLVIERLLLDRMVGKAAQEEAVGPNQLGMAKSGTQQIVLNHTEHLR